MPELRSLRSTDGALGTALTATLVTTLMTALVMVLSGCALLGVESPVAEPAPGTVSEEPQEEAVFYPDGTAEDNLPYFSQRLRAYAADDGPVEGRSIVDAIVDAGFARKRMQVSFDRTATDLVADSIFVSVRIGEECLIGQMLTANREVAVEVAPAVGPKQRTCLIGETRPIDW
ncbi:DUF6993 domain-containing protein [Leucobacter soli]|uniref:DUF6993 domain-containing protein n=1 Tax=Leucobacter soli TaxID=2812850 RepID=A0A916JRI7_9MICO|nr:hypothetical protein [Leucobacter soli]CAG7596509.1 hypothetical protein LEUCIP111803_00090 [Leucobacter soli]